MITEVGNKHTYVLWQTETEMGVPEPAIVATNYPDANLLELVQGRSCINVNHESVPELIRMLNTVKGMKD